MSFNYSTSMWFWFWINRRRNTDVLWETREKKTTLRCKANCWGRRKGITIDCGGVKLSFSVDSSRFSIKRAYCHMFIHIMAWLCSAVAHNRAARQSMCTVLCIHYDKFNSLPSHSSPIFVHLFILEFFFFFCCCRVCCASFLLSWAFASEDIIYNNMHPPITHLCMYVSGAMCPYNYLCTLCSRNLPGHCKHHHHLLIHYNCYIYRNSIYVYYSYKHAWNSTRCSIIFFASFWWGSERKCRLKQQQQQPIHLLCMLYIYLCSVV